MTSWVCATIPMSGTVTYDCIPEVATLPPLLALVWMSLAPPQIHSVSTLAVTLSVAQISEFPLIWLSKYGVSLAAGKLDEAWFATV